MLKHIRQNLGRYSILTGDSQETVVANLVNKTPILHAAIYRGDSKMLDVLLEAGADVDALNSYNQTAIQVVTNPHLEARLIAAGAKKGWVDSTAWRGLVMTGDSFSGSASRFLGEQVRRHWVAGSRNFPVPTDRGLFDPIDNKSPRPKFLSFLQQYDVDINLITCSQVTIMHSALCDKSSTSYLLNLPQIVYCRPFPWHAIGRQLHNIPWINEHWRLFKKRIPPENLRRMMNLHPEKGISPLCQAAAIDSLHVIDHCLEMGADIDFEGSSYGSALSMDIIFLLPLFTPETRSKRATICIDY
ncbi:hypothetical protein F4801DRAFT_471181 [Xylaria longipes]|nr:hypothetical protein F4801DRAFT_471181 [Xylaria longipes]